MLRIVMDGAGDLPAEWPRLYDIHVIPINIQFGEKTYLQGIDLSNEDFYQIVDTTGVIPQTSQPTPTQFVEFYKNIAEPGDTILSIHVTSKLSGTFDSAQMAAQELNGIYNVLPFDSGAGSAAMGYMCKEARLMERAGATVEDILQRLDFIRKNVQIVLALNTLEYARRSGRVKTLQAALASILNVKPLVVLKDGMLDMGDRVRTRQRALDCVVEMVRQRVGDLKVNVAVMHARDQRAAKEMYARVNNAFRCQEVFISDLSISVAANLGPGTVGIIAYPVEGGQ